MDKRAHGGTSLKFLKMHGLGNDFVVIDARAAPDPLTPALARAIGDRHRGVGFDQLAVIHADDGADARLVFWNADGSTSAACGNATRCVAALLMAEAGKRNLVLRTGFDRLACEDAGDGLVSVNMGRPGLGWRDIPLAREADTLALPLPGEPAAVSMGNPHCVFFVEDAEAVDLAAQGRRFETDPLYPERTNVEVAQVLAPDRIRLRIWERGVGVTLASGSCACASVVAAARRGLTGRRVKVTVDGGELQIEWRDDGVWMTGPTAKVFEGELDAAFLEAAQ
ncbi:MAG: diaminopimelate epimerase [Paracoccaceae bacterium]